MRTSKPKPITSDDLLAMPDDGYVYELFRGDLVREPPPGYMHGAYESRLVELLGAHVRKHHLGQVFSGDAGFTLERSPDTTLAPDVAFVSRERWEKQGEAPGYWPGAPDLAIEILSPFNTGLEIGLKVRTYLAAGARLVWVIDPKTRTATVWKPGALPRQIPATGVLDGEDVVPGFRCTVQDILGSSPAG